jgi:hypothetical protein
MSHLLSRTSRELSTWEIDAVTHPAYEITAHGRIAIEARDIRPEWLERVLSTPERRAPDRADPILQHASGRIAENGDRYLRVIYNDSVTPWRIVTAYFDRGLRSEQ